MGLFALGHDDKLQYDDVVVHWVLYPFHDDMVIKSPLVTSLSPSANEPLPREKCPIRQFENKNEKLANGNIFQWRVFPFFCIFLL